MKGLRNSESVIALVLLASLVGHFAIQKNFERRSQAMLRLALAGKSSSSRAPSACPSMDLSEIEELPLPGILSDAQMGGRILPALEIQSGSPSEESHRDSPTAVPVPADADPSATAPAARDNGDSSGVRAVIEQELSHATREEREIWYDELKSVPADVVRDLLKVRKQVHALPRLLGHIPEKLASSDTTISALPREVPAETASQRIRFNAPDYQTATASLETAISQLRHNLTNAATPGFKRFRVTLVDAQSSAWTASSKSGSPDSESMLEARVQGNGCRIAPLLLDMKQGSLRKTNRQFDLAVDGEGFFIVHQGEKEFLTRCGAFTLDCDRQLCLIVTSEISVLQPPIKIPEEAREVQISARGSVTILKSDESELTTVGQLQLGRVPSPARLTPVGNTLLATNDSSGAVVSGIPMTDAFGEIQQGYLEESNVDIETELEEIEKLSTIIKAVPLQNSHPVTARNHPPAPHR